MDALIYLLASTTMTPSSWCMTPHWQRLLAIWRHHDRVRLETIQSCLLGVWLALVKWSISARILHTD